MTSLQQQIETLENSESIHGKKTYQAKKEEIQKDTGDSVLNSLDQKHLSGQIEEYSTKSLPDLGVELINLKWQIENETEEGKKSDLMLKINALQIVAHSNKWLEENNGLYFLGTVTDGIGFPNITEHESKENNKPKKANENIDMIRANSSLVIIKELATGIGPKTVNSLSKFNDKEIIEYMSNLEANKKTKKDTLAWKKAKMLDEEIKNLLDIMYGEGVGKAYKAFVLKKKQEGIQKRIDTKKMQEKERLQREKQIADSTEKEGEEDRWVDQWEEGEVEKAENVILKSILSQSQALQKNIQGWFNEMYGDENPQSKLQVFKNSIFSKYHTYTSKRLNYTQREKEILSKIEHAENKEFRDFCEVIVRQLVSEILEKINSKITVKQTSNYDDVFGGIDIIIETPTKQIGVDIAISNNKEYLDDKAGKRYLTKAKEYNQFKGYPDNKNIPRKVLGVSPKIMANLLQTHLTKVQYDIKEPKLLETYHHIVKKSGEHDQLITQLNAIIK